MLSYQIGIFVFLNFLNLINEKQNMSKRNNPNLHKKRYYVGKKKKRKTRKHCWKLLKRSSVLKIIMTIDWELWRAPVIQLLGGRGLRTL